MNRDRETSQGPSAVRSCGAGALAAAVPTGVALAIGLPDSTVAFVIAGAVAACVFGTLGCLVHLRSPASAREFQVALVLDFLIKLGGLAAGLGTLWAAGVKFPGVAGFGLAYAGCSLAFQLVSSVSLARAWAKGNRASPRSPAGGGTSRSGSPRRVPHHRLTP